MFSYHSAVTLWLKLPMVTEYQYGRGASENVQRNAIVQVSEIESVQHADSVLLDGKYTAASTVQMRSGNVLTVALSVDAIWELLAKMEASDAT